MISSCFCQFACGIFERELHLGGFKTFGLIVFKSFNWWNWEVLENLGFKDRNSSNKTKSERGHQSFKLSSGAVERGPVLESALIPSAV